METRVNEAQANYFFAVNSKVVEHQKNAAKYLTVAARYTEEGNQIKASQSNFIAQTYLDLAGDALQNM